MKDFKRGQYGFKSPFLELPSCQHSPGRTSLRDLSNSCCQSFHESQKNFNLTNKRRSNLPRQSFCQSPFITKNSPQMQKIYRVTTISNLIYLKFPPILFCPLQYQYLRFLYLSLFCPSLPHTHTGYRLMY